jgi:glycogen operon protein
VKLIAEPWDVGEGGYQVGNFPPGWTEWNGRYRDAIRRFWRRDAGVLPELATRLSGSSDLYSHSGRQPHASINFVTAHDGYTLADLVAYEQKHNDANGEENRDGDNNNLSWNCGVEGPTADEGIRDLRERQRRNLLLTLMVSIGVPMVSGGDEVGRTQRGNNNAYCHDSELTWTPKGLALEDAAFLEFSKRLIALRKSQPVLRRRTFPAGRPAGAADVLWLGPDGEEMTESDWNDGERRILGVLLDGQEILEQDARGERIVGDTLLILLNAGDEDVLWTLPAHNGNQWECAINSADPDAEPERVDSFTLVAHSSAVFRLTATTAKGSIPP